MTAEDRVRTVREAYTATCRANQDGLPWNNPWAAAVAALDAYDEAALVPTDWTEYCYTGLGKCIFTAL